MFGDEGGGLASWNIRFSIKERDIRERYLLPIPTCRYLLYLYYKYHSISPCTSLSTQRWRSIVMSPSGRRRAQPTVNGDGLCSTGGAFKRPPLSAARTVSKLKCRDKGLPRVIGYVGGGVGRSHLAKPRSRTDRRRRPGKELSICARNGRRAQAPPPPAPLPRTQPPDDGRRLRRVSLVVILCCCCRKAKTVFIIVIFFFHSTLQIYAHIIIR